MSLEQSKGQRHFQQYFSYIVAVSFIGGGDWSTGETTDQSQVTDKLYHIMLYRENHRPVTSH
jgi:hypothetical protein